MAAVLTPLVLAPLVAHALPGVPAPDYTVAAARDTEPVVLTGADFPGLSVPANVTAKVPFDDAIACPTGGDGCSHNGYAEPEVDTAAAQPSGPDVGLLSGWRWNGAAFEQIPFQVDEMFARYLQNSASGFSPYSGVDKHPSYAFDREGFRYTLSATGNTCLAVPDSATATDPVRGLDHDDEVAFMASDAGSAAPGTATLPAGVDSVHAVEVRDPTRASDAPRYVYVMRGVAPAAAGYVDYDRDANADTFEFSESSYDNHGNAAVGPYCDASGNVVGTGRRRPRDTATVTTDRYTYRYDGRWLMTSIRISGDGGATYGPDVVDRWKARAFQQDPSSETPCCGYEEEDTNWGGSSTLLGERSGPVRTIRETWGADSGTNVIRRETFYRDEMRMTTFLRVHVIPPLDGIYAQWDYAAGRVSRFYTPRVPAGVAVDGVNDEAFGNLDDPCNPAYDGNSTSDLDQAYRSAYRQTQLCNGPYHQSVDLADPTQADVNAGLGWTVMAGDDGAVVGRWQIRKEMTALGAAQSLMAVPYYRDDACFDDGTGADPGPDLGKRNDPEPATTSNGDPRGCWDVASGPAVPGGDEHYYQGSIGTNGLHLLFLAETDNARLTHPVSEIVTEHRQVFVAPATRTPAQEYALGEQYGRGFEKPLVAIARDVTADFG